MRTRIGEGSEALKKGGVFAVVTLLDLVIFPESTFGEVVQRIAGGFSEKIDFLQSLGVIHHQGKEIELEVDGADFGTVGGEIVEAKPGPPRSRKKRSVLFVRIIPLREVHKSPVPLIRTAGIQSKFRAVSTASSEESP